MPNATTTKRPLKAQISDAFVIETILVIDDDTIILELLTEVLTLNKYKVMTAATLSAAHASIRGEHVDLMLCDVSIPDHRQTEEWQLFGADRYRNVPVIFMTSYLPLPDLAKRVLIKPFTEPDLIGAIRAELHPDQRH